MPCYWDDTFDDATLANWEGFPAGTGELPLMQVVGGKLVPIDNYEGWAICRGKVAGDFSAQVDVNFPRQTGVANNTSYALMQHGSYYISLWRYYVPPSTYSVYVEFDGTTIRLDLTYPTETFEDIKFKIVGSGASVEVFIYTDSIGWLSCYTYIGAMLVGTQAQLWWAETEGYPPVTNLSFDNFLYNSGCPATLEEIIGLISTDYGISAKLSDQALRATLVESGLKATIGPGYIIGTLNKSHTLI